MPTLEFPYRMLTPGPVPLHPEVAKILSEPSIHHRTPQFEQTLRKVLSGLKEVFATENPVFIHASTGSGAMESALVNTLSPGDQVLAIVSGKFGERWAKMSQVFGMKTTVLEVPWGQPVDPTDVVAHLRKNPDTKAVLTQACETSTATLHPIRDLGEIIKSYSNTLLMVDAITAVGAMPLPMDSWGLDVVIGGSQKAFMLPTGLSFIALSQKAWRFAELSTSPRFYWDVRAERKSLEKGETHFSTPVQLVRALEVALRYLTGTQREDTYERISNLAEGTRRMAKELELGVYSQAPSPSVTALLVPKDIDSQKLRDHIEKKYNLTLMGGQDQLKGKILRVGHLGYIRDEDMFALVEILFKALKDFDQPLKDSHLERALAEMKKCLL